MKFWKRSVNILIGLGIFVLAGLSGPAGAEMLDTVVARVNKNIITLSSVMEKVNVILMRAEMAQEEPPEQDELKRTVLEGMIREKLILGVVERFGLSMDEKEVQEALDKIQRKGALSEQQLSKMLEVEGKSMEEYKNEIRDQLLINKVINFQVRSGIKVDKEEIKKYYEDHIKDFWQPSKVYARHILFIMGGDLTEEQKDVKERKAREALNRIRGGEDFVEIAQTYSEDITAKFGGDLGPLEKGKMVPEFEKAAFSLKEGEVSPIVRSPYGLHIIRVDKILPGETQPLDKVENVIVNTIQSTKYTKAYEDYIARLKKESFIELKWDVLIPPKTKTKTVAVQDNQKTKIKTVTQEKTLPPKPKPKKVEILPPLTVGQKIEPPKPKPDDPRLRHLEKQLKYYKNLRDMEIISEEEYLSRKQELLSNL